MEQSTDNEYKLLWAEVKHLRDLLKERDKALKLQRKEYKRRLKILNNEHQNVRDNQAKSVLREIYDSEKMEQDKKIDLLTEWKSHQQGKQAMLMLGWGIVTIIIAAFVSFLFSKI